jgi:hypothetical protein
LLKRVLQSYGISRAGARLERRFDELLTKLNPKTTISGKAQFIWKSDSDPANYNVFRMPGCDADRRNPEDWAPEEIAVAVKYVLESQISMPKPELIKETFKVLGYTRSGTAVESAVCCGIETAIKRGWAACKENDRIVLNN